MFAGVPLANRVLRRDLFFLGVTRAALHARKEKFLGTHQAAHQASIHNV